jgi:uncharacterized protein YgiM (DUF1202 family)
MGCFGLLLVMATIARAQPSTETVITAAEVEVRSGPSTKFYATSKLRQGDKVKVVKEVEGGWLAIEPPAGSFSWINARHIERATGMYAQVLSPDVPILIGSSVVKDEPTTQQVKLQRGASVVILDDRTAYNANGGWLPIQPPPQEYRFIPPDAVKPISPVQSTASASPAAAAPAAAQDPLFTQAEQAEKAGNLAHAEDLYLQLARQTTDQNLKGLCYSRADKLHQGYHPPTQPPAAAVPQQPAPTQPPVGQAPAVSYRPPPPASQPPAGQWSGPGYLRRSSFPVDYKPTYVLEASNGMPMIYVTAQPGVNLEAFVNRGVDLYGPIVYRGELRCANYMTASYVKPVP